MTLGPTAIRFQGFSIPGDVDVLYRSDTVVPLEPQAVRVLRYLAEHRTRVVGKQELLERLWPDVATTEAVLKKAVSQIRRALGDDADAGQFIQTLHRRGYRFVAIPEVRSPAPSSPPIESATELRAYCPRKDAEASVGLASGRVTGPEGVALAKP